MSCQGSHLAAPSGSLAEAGVSPCRSILDFLQQPFDALTAFQDAPDPSIVGSCEESANHRLKKGHGLTPQVVERLGRLQDEKGRRLQAPPHDGCRNFLQQTAFLVGERFLVALQRKCLLQPAPPGWLHHALELPGARPVDPALHETDHRLAVGARESQVEAAVGFQSAALGKGTQKHSVGVDPIGSAKGPGFVPPVPRGYGWKHPPR